MGAFRDEKQMKYFQHKLSLKFLFCLLYKSNGVLDVSRFRKRTFCLLSQLFLIINKLS